MSSIPSYITSGALSRAHHAFIVRLHQVQLGSGNGSGSEVEELKVVREERERCLGVLKGVGLPGRGLSNRTTAETLVILLHTTFVPRLIDSSSRPRPLTRSTHGSPHDGPSSSASSSFPNDHPGTSRQIDRKGKGRATADDPTTGSERPDPSARSRTGADGDADVALLAALNLATASNNIREKRIGYLYLAECMEVGHELGLMFINTIRKDLSSANTSFVLLALHAIVKSPSAELGPAVIPLLVMKGLLKHEEPAIRQRTLQALMSLHFTQPHQHSLPIASSSKSLLTSFPLSMGKITRLLENEDDPSVIRALLDLIRRCIDTGAHTVQTAEERAFLVDAILRSMEGAYATPLACEAVRCFALVMDKGTSARVDAWLGDLLARKQPHRSGWQHALLLEACSLLSSSADQELDMKKVTHAVLMGIVELITPRTHHSRSPASSTSHSRLDHLRIQKRSAANEHILALRCLTRLPAAVWDGRLGDEQMGVVMQGLESGDDSVRKATLRLLYHLSPDLLSQTLSMTLENLSTASDLSLPLDFPSPSPRGRKGGALDLAEDDHRARAGLAETASRALEVVEVTASVDDVNVSCDNEGRDDADCAGGVVMTDNITRVLVALKKGQYEAGVSDEWGDREVWEDGFRRCLILLWNLSAKQKARALCNLASTSDAQVTATSALLLAASAYAYADILQTEEEVMGVCKVSIRNLGSPACDASVRELSLVGLVAVLVRTETPAHTGLPGTIELLQSAREGQRSGSTIEQRIDQVLVILREGLLEEVGQLIQEDSLPEYLSAIRAVYKEYIQRSKTRDAEIDANASASDASLRAMMQTKDLSASKLRYDAYDAPSAPKGRTRPRQLRNEKENEKLPGTHGIGTRRLRSDGPEGASLLFDSEALETEDLALSDLTIGSSRRISDPFDQA